MKRWGLVHKHDCAPDPMPLTLFSLPGLRDHQDNGSTIKKLSSGTKIKVRYFHSQVSTDLYGKCLKEHPRNCKKSLSLGSRTGSQQGGIRTTFLSETSEIFMYFWNFTYLFNILQVIFIKTINREHNPTQKIHAKKMI